MVDKIILWHLFKFRQVPLYCIKKWDLSQAEGAERACWELDQATGGYSNCLRLPPPLAPVIRPSLAPALLPVPAPMLLPSVLSFKWSSISWQKEEKFEEPRWPWTEAAHCHLAAWRNPIQVWCQVQETVPEQRTGFPGKKWRSLVQSVGPLQEILIEFYTDTIQGFLEFSQTQNNSMCFVYVCVSLCVWAFRYSSLDVKRGQDF